MCTTPKISLLFKSKSCVAWWLPKLSLDVTKAANDADNPPPGS